VIVGAGVVLAPSYEAKAHVILDWRPACWTEAGFSRDLRAAAAASAMPQFAQVEGPRRTLTW
jgi:hypothetical protein